MRSVHPGEVLKDELDYLEVTPIEFERQIAVPPCSVHSSVHKIIAGSISVTDETAVRIGRRFGVDPQFWLNLQSQFDRFNVAGQAEDEKRRSRPEDWKGSS